MNTFKKKKSKDSNILYANKLIIWNHKTFRSDERYKKQTKTRCKYVFES